METTLLPSEASPQPWDLDWLWPDLAGQFLSSLLPDGGTYRGLLLTAKTPQAPLSLPLQEKLEGKGLVYVAGLAGSVQSALPLLAPLLLTNQNTDERACFDWVLGLDLPGFGLNNTLALPATASAQLQGLQSVLTQWGLFQTKAARPHLAGLSLGGVMATLLAHKHPQNWQGIWLLAPSFKAHPKRFGLGFTLANVGKLLLQGKAATMTIPYGVEALTQVPEALNHPRLLKVFPFKAPIAYMLSVQALQKQAWKALTRLKLPVQLLCPEADTICCPKAMAQAFNRLPQSAQNQWVGVPNLMHDVGLEAQDPALNAAIVGPYQSWLGLLTL